MKRLSGLGYKRAFFLMLLALVLLSIIAYQRALKPTVEVYERKAIVEKGLMGQATATARLESLEREYRMLRQKIGDTSLDPAELRALAVREVVDFSNDRPIEMVGLEEAQTVSEPGYELSTHRIKIQGGFHDLLELHGYLEQEVSAIHLTAVRYVVEKERKTKTKKLYVEFIFQNIKKI